MAAFTISHSQPILQAIAKSGTADWVQAIGSVAALLVTAGVVYWQEKRRRDDIDIARLKQRTDQLESLVAMADAVIDLVDDHDGGTTYFILRYSDKPFEDLERAWADVPVHEARSGRIAAAIMAFRRETAAIREYLAKAYAIRTLSKPSRGQAWQTEADHQAFAESVAAVKEARQALEMRLQRVVGKLPGPEAYLDYRGQGRL